MKELTVCVSILIKGIVQGVGFRPFVYNLAKKLDIKGYVANTPQGVIIEAEGICLNEFVESLQNKCPPLAKIDSIDISELNIKGYKDFTIVDSITDVDNITDNDFTFVSPDISVCDDCLKEMFDSSNRRYLYPFINCINCGPRYSIVKKVPYDRQNTTMSVFNMCPECLSEYNNPADRRFHAQPNACHKCGPKLKLQITDRSSRIDEITDPIKATVELLSQGAIVAIKGIGGFHLCCNATSEKAVNVLRKRKRRGNKPFALMSLDIGVIRQFCKVSEGEEALLKNRCKPIVLLEKRGGKQRANGKELPEKIAPNNKYLGFMLPYTPLHYLLFYYSLTSHLSSLNSHFTVFVMTSGNISGEPIAVGNDEAMSKLSNVADAFLFHDRDIFTRMDDSIVRVMGKAEGEKISFIRRSRGYVPEPIYLSDNGAEVLSCGADIKNTFTIVKGNYVVVSQHIGDMENFETLRFFEESLNNLKLLFRTNPVAIAHDLHPEYLSTKWALKQRQKAKNEETEKSLKIYGIQHHYAHIASVMAENRLKEKIIGVAFDGTGYGADGNLWGSEFLVCDLDGFERVAHFKYISLPGGQMAIKECWRTAISYIVNCGGQAADFWNLFNSIKFIERFGRDKIDNIIKLVGNRQFSPLSSGAGRLFDAVAAIVGICDVNSFEGEAALALENAMRIASSELQNTKLSAAYPFELVNCGNFQSEITNSNLPVVIDFSRMLLRIIEDVKCNEDRSLIAIKFHNTIINATTEVVGGISRKYSVKKVALSGGVFQNSYLLEKTSAQLSSSGLEVYINEKVPCNDAGISLGQTYIVRERLKRVKA